VALSSYIRADNGPKIIYERHRDLLRRVEIGMSNIGPGSPWENGHVTCYHSRLQGECLGCEIFQSIADARNVIERGVRITITGGP